ncbi:MAG: lipid-binding SYLF domain-containing protein [Thermodesulfobacteriota bacterium]
MKTGKIVALFLLATLIATLPALAKSGKEEAAEELTQCQEALTAVAQDPEAGIPESILEKCEAVVIFANVKKFGLGIGGMQGYGVMLARDKDRNWSAPAFYRIRAASTGFQVGALSMDNVLCIMDRDSVQNFLTKEFTLGADISIAAGPTKKSADPASTLDIKTKILTYTKVKKGLYAGVSIEGSRIAYLSDMTRDFYGKPLQVQDILLENKEPVPEQAKPLIELLVKFATPEAAPEKPAAVQATDEKKKSDK